MIELNYPLVTVQIYFHFLIVEAFYYFVSWSLLLCLFVVFLQPATSFSVSSSASDPCFFIVCYIFCVCFLLLYLKSCFPISASAPCFFFYCYFFCICWLLLLLLHLLSASTFNVTSSASILSAFIFTASILSASIFTVSTLSALIFTVSTLSALIFTASTLSALIFTASFLL